MYSVRISTDYRALGVLGRDAIVWFWIGPHHEYDRMLGRMSTTGVEWDGADLNKRDSFDGNFQMAAADFQPGRPT